MPQWPVRCKRLLNEPGPIRWMRMVLCVQFIIVNWEMTINLIGPFLVMTPDLLFHFVILYVNGPVQSISIKVIIKLHATRFFRRLIARRREALCSLMVHLDVMRLTAFFIKASFILDMHQVFVWALRLLSSAISCHHRLLGYGRLMIQIVGGAHIRRINCLRSCIKLFFLALITGGGGVCICARLRDRN